jgi:hypothetical protein
MKQMDSPSQALLGIIRPVPYFLFCGLNAEELDAFWTLAIRHKMFMLSYARLNNIETVSDSDSRITNYLKANKSAYLTGVARALQQEAIESAVFKLLKAYGIDSLVIKGNPLAREIYDCGYCRASSDIDILIRERDIFNSDSALTSAGYLRESQDSLEFSVRRRHHAVYHHPATAITLEVHWNFGIPGFFEISSEEIWNGVIFDSENLVGLCPEMTVIMLLIHHHMHFFRDLWVLVDLFHSLNKYGIGIDHDAFVQRLSRIGLCKTAIISLCQISELWGEEGADLIQPKALALALNKAGYSASNFLTVYFRIDLVDEKILRDGMDRAMSRVALDRPVTVVMSVVKILLPGPSAIMHFYRDTRVWTLPYNYMKFIFWRLKGLAGKQQHD